MSDPPPPPAPRRASGLTIAFLLLVAILGIGALAGLAAHPGTSSTLQASVSPSPTIDASRQRFVAFSTGYERIRSLTVLGAAIDQMSAAAKANNLQGVRQGLRDQASALRTFDTSMDAISVPSVLYGFWISWRADNEDWANADMTLADMTTAGLNAAFYTYGLAETRFGTDRNSFEYQYGFWASIYGVPIKT